MLWNGIKKDLYQAGIGVSDNMFRAAIGRQAAQGPLYRQVSAAIADLIGSGALKPGVMLPPERELAAMTGLSRVTVSRAMKELVKAGRLMQRQGSGTYVANQTTAPAAPQQGLSSFSEEMTRRGLVARSDWLSRSINPPTNEEMMSLGLSAHDMVARLVRVRVADGAPLAIERTSLPAFVLPDPAAIGSSLYDALRASGHTPVRGIQRITATNLTPKDAQVLGILSGAAALRIERVSYLASGRALEYTRGLYRGDNYDLVTELT